MSDNIYCLWLQFCKGINKAGKMFLLSLYGSCRDIYEAPDAELAQLFDVYPEL